MATYRFDHRWSLFLGYAFLNGGEVFADKDTHWASGQVAFRY